MFAFIAAVLREQFDAPIRVAAEAQASVAAYRDRMLQQFYPEQPTAA